MWKLFFRIAVACIPAALVLGVMARGSERCKKKHIHAFHVLLAGAFLAVAFLFLPIFRGTGEGSFEIWARSVLLAIFHAMQVFTIGCEFSVVTEGLTICPEAWQSIYETGFSIAYVAAPVLTFGFVLSLFKNMSAYMKYFTIRRKELYVFSELNDRSLALASDLKRNNKKCGIVFADVREEGDETNGERKAEAKKIGAVCFKKDILLLHFRRRRAKKSTFFFAIGEDEAENVNIAIKLIERYQELENSRIYVFSTGVESELLLTDAQKGNIKVHRINEARSLINRVLYENGDILFQSAKPEGGGMKRIGAVVVGMGKHGTEMVKALSWYGQMDGYRLSITAFDRDRLARHRFTALAPELMDPRYNGVIVEGEAQYTIQIHPAMDVETSCFARKIAKLTDTTYVLVALGNDEMNIKTAVMLRMYFERMNIHPVIQAIVYNTRQKKALEGIINYRGQAYDIDFIGDLESSYAKKVIINSELEDDALLCHLGWDNAKEEDFWAYEYNYRSSTASAIHTRAKRNRGIPGVLKAGKDLTPQEEKQLQQLEHRRWNAYMRSEGYVFGKTKNDLGKMHHDLVNFEKLSDSEKKKDSRVATAGRT